MKTCTRALRTSDRGRSFPFQQDNDPKHAAKTTQFGFGTSFWMSLSGPARARTWTPIEHLWRDLKIAVQLHPPIQPDRARDDLQRRMGYRCAKLVVAYLRRLNAVINCQRCFNKVLSKGSDYLCKSNISVFLKLFWWGEKNNLISSRIRL
jgi:hypothetical protein